MLLLGSRRLELRRRLGRGCWRSSRSRNSDGALRLATGLNVEEWETNRTNYMSRGFDIKNTQVDGVGLPNNWGIVTGAMDSAGYEKIEVIRGANGLLTGVGSSAGTLNYVRKRPTNDALLDVQANAGSWNFKRLSADYSTPLTQTGSWAMLYWHLRWTISPEGYVLPRLDEVSGGF